MREAEIKHSRLAMLAVVGWPLAELFDKPIADAVGLPTLLTKSGESPSLLNGGLDKIDIAYWVAVIAAAGIIELENMKIKEEKSKEYVPGDCGFDPLGFLPKDKAGKMAMMTKEIKHGRIAMMAILGFAIQEAIYGIPVVQETPVFFTPAF
jgi:Chlorophyll A-B binding protein